MLRRSKQIISTAAGSSLPIKLHLFQLIRRPELSCCADCYLQATNTCSFDNRLSDGIKRRWLYSNQ